MVRSDQQPQHPHGLWCDTTALLGAAAMSTPHRGATPLAAFYKASASASTNLILVAVMREPVALADALLVRSPFGIHPHPPHRCPHVVPLFAGIDGNLC